MVDLVGMAEQWYLTWQFLAGLWFVYFPTANQSIAVAREHKLMDLIAEETERGNVVCIEQFSLVFLSVEWVIGDEIFHFTVCFFEFI